MAFWHNSRYEDVEKSSTGDPLRGLPEQQFPWLLTYATISDEMNDTWHYELSCLGIIPEKNNNKIKATLFMIAECKVSKLNLKQIGISSDRLEAMGVESWNYLEEKFSCEIICDFDKLESKAKSLADKWLFQLRKKYTLELKARQLLEKIKTSRISKFSE
ncbi:hypothetical protein [Silvanigrella aquatica]|uniref:Uncharacterized protein n=1 Tax=Silvanigrella aquatica TaxID=1915309 RepID=A0A1L4CZT3_9BACT|nr:hypothetical protein [Silvanigrella aquatica]APJ03448.1 hypothetical protein AXG55_05830 [Silvanigrella aquatica]